MGEFEEKSGNERVVSFDLIDTRVEAKIQMLKNKIAVNNHNISIAHSTVKALEEVNLELGNFIDDLNDILID